MAAHEGGSGSSSHMLMAFAVGAAVGAVVALLYAPASGEETRRQIRRKARNTRNRVTDLTEDLKTGGRDFLARQREHVEAAVERGREVFERARREPADQSSKEKV